MKIIFLPLRPEKILSFAKTVPFITRMEQSGRRLAMIGLRRCIGGRRAKLATLIQDSRREWYTLHLIFDWINEQIQTYLQ
ncbi:hypothetical protein BIY37_11070 [Candidatus Brocadia sapporoensis]|uniref:Uncharacterized protein n=1 Tax=Candidatus Brocadia sapporoensis TaxID=392547 RepID=A0A1V6LXT9_9BACT|nr:hypothetical protein [Candidatus Brocadia sapporoensis]MDG6004903.1 hypothetical protein [Candidatus Brocadia sp.]OQD44955.1 hypothetical protein BIY37_11070 [Candidatus Brocadia sapporoensis]